MGGEVFGSDGISSQSQPDLYPDYYTSTEYDWLLETLNFTLQMQQDAQDGNLSSLDLEENNYDHFFEFWLYGVLLNLIGVLGLIGNTISITILSRPQMKSSINCLLIGLASFDIVLIITSILMFGLPSIYTHSLVA